MSLHSVHMGSNEALYSNRRKKLLAKVKEAYPSCRTGALVLFAGFECDRIAFRQESFFYYFTGIREPALALVIDFSGQQILFVPAYKGKREQWVTSSIVFDDAALARLGFDKKETWGEPVTGYQMSLPLHFDTCKNLIGYLHRIVQQGGSLCTVFSTDAADGIQQRLIQEQLNAWIPGLDKSLVDVTPQASALRRCKDTYEIGSITTAIEITILAQESAARTLANDIQECEVKGHIEYVYAASGTRAAFSSIVAAGRNGTVLHYTDGAGTMYKGDLVVVDIGAEYDGYAADITRTYPVSGKFTPRQQELYTLVLDTQLYIADLAKPGIWLNNKDNPEQSLNHLAHAYLDKYGYGEYFPHGIGHFLGLDVHDVGDYKIPLAEGDVITIEPGIYIPQEGLGIRIEDDYWIAAKGSMCLSDELPKAPDELCAWMERIRQV